jgi:virginiamycin B lyase
VGKVSEYSIPTSASNPHAITAGPDGYLWFTELDKIGRITPTGAISEYPIPTSASNPLGIAAGPNDTLWFTEPPNNIGEVLLRPG